MILVFLIGLPFISTWLIIGAMYLHLKIYEAIPKNVHLTEINSLTYQKNDYLFHN